MRKICLTLPTNRACADTLSAVIEEARYAVERFDVEVRVLVLDSSDAHDFAAHAQVVRAARRVPKVSLWHLDEAYQRSFLNGVIRRAGLDRQSRLPGLMLPAGVSYGACTNRAFLFGAALGCESVHRRDSDSRYQVVDDAKVFPIHHELASLGKSAADAAPGVSESELDPGLAERPVVLVGGSFVGEPSVDIEEIHRLDEDVYYDIVSLWAPAHASEEEKRNLVKESFRGSGAGPFARDHSTLTVLDPMRVDMCNIGFSRVHEQIPLLPATDTIGSDYFLLHVVHAAGLPAVQHNRDIMNFHTPERRTESGFVGYQLRLVKFFLSMQYLNFIYGRMKTAGESLCDERDHVRASAISAVVRESLELDDEENVLRLDCLQRGYRKLGGKYTKLAEILASRGSHLLSEARQDIADFALLIDHWERLMSASREADLVSPPGG
ncbi:DUF6271 family protein [Amycolatopsis roodepoortensis]|uniref:Uncharacterized protein n=1 Tax=Amycolatopsis roodepoortensis TaxID=700274 RepID=A0ABR9L165_9PSEU|nr:DUF6271 family protein [Amycolatopsis roodepoortensis]MBE1574369.1 hypothetical protein [Amycolatopsis roodepoortensis]